MARSTVEAAIEAYRSGGMVVVVDAADRENEGDVCVAASLVTAEHVNFMARHARGLVCLAMAGEKIDQLELEPMVQRNGCAHGTAFTVSIEARTGVTTGISAADRARTIRVAADAGATPEDVVSPGHVFPLRARDGGVLERPGHTEATVDLARLAGLEPASVICEVMNDDGSMARRDDLDRFAREHDLPLITIEQLAAWMRGERPIVERVADTSLPTAHGDFRMLGYRGGDGQELLALVHGELDGREDVLVRIHSACVTGDVLGSRRCDCGEQLDAALTEIQAAGQGVLLYLPQEGRGIGLLNKLRAYELQDTGVDTLDANRQLGFEPDLREYDLAVAMLNDLGVRSVRLLTNNPDKLGALARAGFDAVERVPLAIPARPENRDYLETKRDRFGHLLTAPALVDALTQARAVTPMRMAPAVPVVSEESGLLA